MSSVYSHFMMKFKHFFTKFYLTFCFALCSLVVLWQKTRFIRSFFFSCCRFYPSCSDYFLQAIKKHGLLYGFVLFLKRLVRCNPLCSGGVDEVPLKIEESVRLTKKSICPALGGQMRSGKRDWHKEASACLKHKKWILV